MKIIIIIFLALFLYVVVIPSKDTVSIIWTIGVPLGSESNLMCVKEDYEHNIITGGNIVFVNNNLDGLIMKLNDNGDLLWMQYLSDYTTNDCVYDILPLQDNSYVLTGRFKNKFFLKKINSNGDSIWMKIYDYVNTSGGQCIALNNIGGFVVVGSMNGGGIIYTDSMGNVLWDKIIGNTNTLNTVCRLNNRNYLIGGDTIIIIDESGTILWQSRHRDGLTITSVIENSRGDFIFTSNNAFKICCVNSEDSLKWIYSLGGAAFDVIEIYFLNYIVVGGISPYFGYFVKLDSLGGKIWDVTYGYPYEYGAYYTSIDKCANANFVFCGNFWQDYYPNRGYVKRASNEVTFVNENFEDLVNSVNLTTQNNGLTFKINLLESTVVRINLYDITGRTLPQSFCNYFNPGNIEINLDIEIPGQYFYFIESDVFVKSGKFIVFE